MMEFLKGIGTITSLVVNLKSLLGPTFSRFKKPDDSLDYCHLNISENWPHRFLALFEAHGVNRNQISRFFDHGLLLADCSDAVRLRDKLTDEMLEEAASLFGVNIEWLGSGKGDVYNTHDFHYQPDLCRDFITELQKAGSELKAYCLTANKPDRSNGNDAAIVVLEKIGEAYERDIQRIYILSGWSHGYGKSRAYYTAALSQIKAANLLMHGREVDCSWLQQFSTGEKLPLYDMNSEGFDFNSTGRWWQPYEMMEIPEKFLENVDPESANDGVKIALELWLELEAKGDIKMEKQADRKAIRKAFEMRRAAIKN